MRAYAGIGVLFEVFKQVDRFRTGPTGYPGPLRLSLCISPILTHI